MSTRLGVVTELEDALYCPECDQMRDMALLDNDSRALCMVCRKPLDELRKCYLCEREITQLPGQEFKLQCEKGAPITVCEECYEEAETEF